MRNAAGGFAALAVAAGLVLTEACAWADVESGPAIGEAAPALPVSAVTGAVQDKDLDYAAERGEKPTLYVLVPADKWNRPMARLLVALDKLAADMGDDAYLVAVWLTDDAAAAKEYLPKAQASLQFSRTALTVSTGDKSGPQGWAVNGQADVTVVVAAKGKVAARFGFVSANETVAREVAKAWKEAVANRE